MRSSCSLLAVVLLALPARADGPTDNLPDQVRRIPKLGIEVPADERAKLEQEIDALDKAIQELAARDDATVRDLLPDVRIYHRAVHDSLQYQEFFDPKELAAARGIERIHCVSLVDSILVPTAKSSGAIVTAGSPAGKFRTTFFRNHEPWSIMDGRGR